MHGKLTIQRTKHDNNNIPKLLSDSAVITSGQFRVILECTNVSYKWQYVPCTMTSQSSV